jgi:hypothetical protein
VAAQGRSGKRQEMIRERECACRAMYRELTSSSRIQADDPVQCCDFLSQFMLPCISFDGGRIPLILFCITSATTHALPNCPMQHETVPISLVRPGIRPLGFSSTLHAGISENKIHQLLSLLNPNGLDPHRSRPPIVASSQIPPFLSSSALRTHRQD